MVDGKTQAFADLMIYNLEIIAVGAAVVFVLLLGVLMVLPKTKPREGDARAKAIDECEAIARRHMTYGLPDFPPAFNGGYRGAARAITDNIVALRTEPR